MSLTTLYVRLCSMLSCQSQHCRIDWDRCCHVSHCIINKHEINNPAMDWEVKLPRDWSRLTNDSLIQWPVMYTGPPSLPLLKIKSRIGKRLYSTILFLHIVNIYHTAHFYIFLYIHRKFSGPGTQGAFSRQGTQGPFSRQDTQGAFYRQGTQGAFSMQRTQRIFYFNIL